MSLNARGMAGRQASRQRSGHWITAALCAGLFSVSVPSRAATGCGAEVLSVAQAHAAVEFVRIQVREAHWHAPSNLEEPSVQALGRLLKSISTPLSSADSRNE